MKASSVVSVSFYMALVAQSMLRRALQGHERIMSERSTQSALGVGCPHRNNGHSDNRARPGD
jgi:hypothetical protein